MKTTLNQIRANSPCPDGWRKLLAHLGKTQADDEPLSIATESVPIYVEKQMQTYSDACNAALQSQVRVLREALTHISLCSKNSMSSKDECGSIARAALEATK